ADLRGVLSPGGAAFLEVGAGQAQSVARILCDAGLGAAQTRADLDGRARVLRVRRE
ncbi:MAG: protein-(glutamine-N5) methyltransferase, release factor-specific, partial [Alphaproteobacteria bacterium HGW-Alphaproteobacteria-8]